MYDKIIYGESSLERVVGMEPHDSHIELFIEHKDGRIETQLHDNYYWMLSDLPHGKDWFRLAGNLHYKYARVFNSKKELNQEYYKLNKFRNKDIYIVWNKKEAFMLKSGVTYFKGMQAQEPSILSFDIETTSLKPEDKNAQVLIIANTYRKQGKIERKMFCYNDYPSQAAMIDAWCAFVREINPSIILGYNICMFDLPYLHVVASRNNTNLSLGRDNSNLYFNKEDSMFRKDGSQFYTYKKVNVYGREVIDGFFLALKYDVGRKYDNYKLKEIVKHEKLAFPGRVYYDGDQIRFNYTNPEEFEKIKAYASFDGDEALQLYDLMSPAFFYMTQSIPKNYQTVLESASGSQLNSIMMRSYIQEEHSLPKADEAVKFEGAISFGNPGVYNNVFKVDVASLYPSIMLEYQVFPKHKDINNNMLYALEYFTKERLKNKKLAKDNKYFDDLQNSQKIMINSMYGFMGANGLHFNFPGGAAQVTKHGRDILEKAISWATGKDFLIVNADTDSISFCKLDHEEFTKEEQVTLLKELNSNYPDRIRFEHDGMFKTILIVKAKNYVLVSEDGKVKTKGSALKATNKEIALKEFINEAISLLLVKNIDGLVPLYNKYVLEINEVKDITRWSSKKTVTNKILNPERTNELKVKEALENEESIQEGDKHRFYFKIDNSLSLDTNFNGDYNKDKLFEKLFKTAMVFETVIPNIKEVFLNYKLKRSKKVLEELLANNVNKG